MTAEKPVPIPLPTPPDMLLLTTGEEVLIEETVDIFFQSIVKAIAIYNKNDLIAERNDFELYRTRNIDGKEHALPTNDNIRILTVNGTVAATVLDRSDDLNYHQVLSTLTLSPELVTKDEPKTVLEIVRRVVSLQEATAATEAFFAIVLDKLGIIPQGRKVFTEQTIYSLYPFGLRRERDVNLTSDMRIAVLTANDIGVASVLQKKKMIGGN